MEPEKFRIPHWSYFLPPAILSLITAISYYPSLRYDFQFDDIANITKHFNIRHYSFGQLFFSGTRWISYWLNSLHYKIGKFEPLSYRTGNLIIHVINGFLVFLVLFFALSRLKKENFFKQNSYLIALLTSALFLLHPVQTQTVSYVIQGQLEGMATMFVLSMVLCFLQLTNARTAITKYVLTALLYVLALLSCGTKEIAIVSPLLMLMVDWFFVAQGKIDQIKSRLWLHGTIFGLVFCTYIYLLKPRFFLNILGLQAEAKNNIGNIITKHALDKITPGIFFMSQFKVILHYLWIFIWPFNISVEYDWKLVEGLFAPDCILPLLALATIAGIVIRILIKNPTSLIAFSALWALICIAPRSSIIPSPELIADYKTYMSSFGWLFLLAAGLIKTTEFILNKVKKSTALLHDIRVQSASALACAVLFGILTNQRNIIWSSGLEFWGNIIQNAPGKARAYNNYGVDLSQKYGKFQESIPYFKKAIAMDKHYPDPCNNLAVAYARTNDIDGAISAMKQGLRINPYYPEGYNNLASFLLQQKKYDTAQKALETAIKLRPYYGKAYYNLGRLHLEQNRPEEAWACFKKCCTEGDLDNAAGFGIYAKVSLALKKYEDAIYAYSKVLEFNPGDEDAAFNLGNTYYLVQQYERARDIYEQVLRHNASNPRVLYNAGETYCKLNQPAQAIDYFERIPFYKKQIPQMYLRMASCYEQLGDIAKAKKELSEALSTEIPNDIRQTAQQYLNKLGGGSVIAKTQTQTIPVTQTKPAVQVLPDKAATSEQTAQTQPQPKTETEQLSKAVKEGNQKTAVSDSKETHKA